jgi:tetratricopeptide (TPR) repeat protein
MTPCPTDDELRHLLGGQLPADSADPLTRHTDQCAACQKRLEQLLDDPAESRWRALLGQAGDEAAPTKLAPYAEGFDTARAAVCAQLAATVRLPEDGPILRRLRVDPTHGKPPTPPAPPGYEILSELGRGGMGVVYKARQTPLKRLVALKVIATGVWAGPSEVARFRAEAEAVAQLQHPNIVQIHEIGEHDGRPFFSLEYVAGGSLAQHLDGTPLPPRDAAELVRTLALAIQAAHQRGIVHRDLKPGNILLSFSRDPPGSASDALPGGSRLNEAVPKIADFGLAKRLGGEPGLTLTGAVIGTPSYMAPEQAQGQVHHIGPAADTYALGAILYELLTGRPPFRGATSLDTLQQVQSQTPVAPSRLQPQVPRDLETICLKCLEKEPHKRYDSARALAEDLQHFLAGEPIIARPAGLWERTWKWARRRPAYATLLCVLIGVPVILLAVGGWSYLQLKESNEFAEGVVEDMYTRVAEEWLADEPQKDPLQKDFLEKALGFYQRLARKGGTGSEARRRTGLAYFRVGQLYRSLNRREEAADAYRQAIALQEQLQQQFKDDPGYRQDLANSYNWLGELLRDGGSLKEAEQNYLKALELQKGLHDRNSAEPSYRRELARSHSNLGLVEMDTDRPNEARKDFDRAVELLEQLERDCPPNEFRNDVRHELARTLTNRGVFRHAHKMEGAENDYRRAIDLLEKLRQTGRMRTIYEYNLAIAYQDLGNILFERRKYDDALGELGRARAILVRLVEGFPHRPRYKKKLARTYNSRGSALAEQGRWGEAEDSWKEARRLFGELPLQDAHEDEYQADLGRCVGNLGWLKAQRRDLDGARSDLDEAADRIRRALAPPNAERLDYREALREQYQTLAEVLVRAGDHGEAAKRAAELAEVFPERPQGHYYAACFVARCVPLAEKKGDAADADQYASQAATFLRQALRGGLKGEERLPEETDPIAAPSGGPVLCDRVGQERPPGEKDIFGPLRHRAGWADSDLLEKLEALGRPAAPKAVP